MLPRQTMSMLWYMILFSVYGLKKSVSQTIRYCFSVCAVCTAFVCRLCNWRGLCVICILLSNKGLTAGTTVYLNVLSRVLTLLMELVICDITRFQRVTGAAVT